MHQHPDCVNPGIMVCLNSAFECNSLAGLVISFAKFPKISAISTKILMGAADWPLQQQVLPPLQLSILVDFGDFGLYCG
jgi:hypothetical protein